MSHCGSRWSKAPVCRLPTLCDQPLLWGHSHISNSLRSICCGWTAVPSSPACVKLCVSSLANLPLPVPPPPCLAWFPSPSRNTAWKTACPSEPLSHLAQVRAAVLLCWQAKIASAGFPASRNHPPHICERLFKEQSKGTKALLQNCQWFLLAGRNTNLSAGPARLSKISPPSLPACTPRG